LVIGRKELMVSKIDLVIEKNTSRKELMVSKIDIKKK
jgi:hypothetical protein